MPGVGTERMEFTDYLRFFAALVFVLALIGGLAWLLRRFGPGAQGLRRHAGPRRLEITEIRPLDAKRRLLLVRRDSVEHLLLVGGQSDLLIETLAADGRVAGISKPEYPA